ncbi:DUF1858 domain-containing protein [Nanoarchaeota archaeon]
MKITKDMTILEVVQKCPEAGEILFETGMHCLGCHMAGQETLEQGLKAHGMDDKQVEEIVKKINEKTKK